MVSPGEPFSSKHLRCVEPDSHPVASTKGRKVSIFASFSKQTMATAELEDEKESDDSVRKEPTIKVILLCTEDTVSIRTKAA